MASSNSRGAAGFPANAQGNRVSFAQSAGKNSSFQGGTGGNAWQSAGGGARGTGRKAQSILGNGTTYNVRSAGGDSTLVPGAHGGAGKLNLPTGANPSVGRGPSIVTPHELAPKGFGGGY
jgi:hypothetical protein